MLVAASAARRNGRSARPLLTLLTQRALGGRAGVPAVQAPAPAQLMSSVVVPLHSQSLPAPQPGCGTRGIASAALAARGGAFVLQRRLQPLPDAGYSKDTTSHPFVSGAAGALPEPPSPGRSLSTSRTVFCNLQTSDLDESPFGQAPESESDEEEEVPMAMSVGGTVLFGQPAAPSRRPAQPKIPSALGQARWIGSAPHSGDWTRASTKQPADTADPPVWAKIIGACSDSPEQLKATVSMLHLAFKQSGMVPPLPAYNKLLQLASKSQDVDIAHQLTDMAGGLQLNEDSHKWLDACFPYNNRIRH